MKKFLLLLVACVGCDKELMRPAPVANPGSFDDAGMISKEENDLLDSASVALDKNDDARALELLAEHRKRYPTSGLEDVRAGLEISAHCRQKKDGEQTNARRYLLQHPGSELTPRIWRACGLGNAQ